MGGLGKNMDKVRDFGGANAGWIFLGKKRGNIRGIKLRMRSKYQILEPELYPV